MVYPNFKDHFSGHASDYSAYRPTYSPELFAWLAEQAPARELAWDCATAWGEPERAHKVTWPIDLRVVRNHPGNPIDSTFSALTRKMILKIGITHTN